MEPEEQYREIIRMKKNMLISNIMRKYLEIMYERKKVVRTSYTKYLDREMLKTIIHETNKFMEDFIK